MSVKIIQDTKNFSAHHIKCPSIEDEPSQSKIFVRSDEFQAVKEDYINKWNQLAVESDNSDSSIEGDNSDFTDNNFQSFENKFEKLSHFVENATEYQERQVISAGVSTSYGAESISNSRQKVKELTPAYAPAVEKQRQQSIGR